MAAQPDLDDLNQVFVSENSLKYRSHELKTVFSIPFAGSDAEEEPIDPAPVALAYDLPDGENLRLEAYKQAWLKCLDKMKSIIQNLHAPIASKIVEEVQNAFSNTLPGLAYPEVPVISVTNPTSGSTFLNEVISRIPSFNLENAEGQAGSFTTQLYPTDCTNLSSLMKALIAGFIDRPVIERVKGRSAVSLANYDIEMLVAWYRAVRNTHNIEQPFQPKLVILLHDFEQLDPLVVQDLFSIASLYIAKLPLVFILSLSSPSTPSYLQITYPRSTLALLRVRNFSVPSGLDVLQRVILQTFFNVHFEPDITIGPGILSFINDFITRQNVSLDSLITILQLAHLKHFSLDPFTLLVHDTPDLSGEASEPFVEALGTHLSSSPEFEHDVDTLSLLDLSQSVDEARDAFSLKMNRTRFGLRIVAHVQESVGKRGHIPLNLDPEKGGIDTVELICDVLRNEAGADIKLLGNSIKKLRPEHLADLLKTLKTQLNPLPDNLRTSERDFFQYLTDMSRRLNQDPDNGSQLGSEFATWLTNYLKDMFEPLEKSPLWNVWYTGETEFPSELINPSMRASLIAGLSNPHEFCESSLRDHNGDTSDPDEALWTYPDTSILFRRYLDSGKMINIYDWFESFKLVLETQHEHLKVEARKQVDKAKEPKSSKGKKKNTRVYGRGCRKGAAAEMDVDEEAEEEEVGAQLNEEEEVEIGEEDEDAWKLQVQARFMRTFHELDYLGFLKHTGRKPDHVLRTVFDLLD